MVFSANYQQCLQLYRSGHFYWQRRQEYLEKTTDLPHSLTDFITKIHRVHLIISGIRTHNFSGDRH